MMSDTWGTFHTDNAVNYSSYCKLRGKASLMPSSELVAADSAAVDTEDCTLLDILTVNRNNLRKERPLFQNLGRYCQYTTFYDE